MNNTIKELMDYLLDYKLINIQTKKETVKHQLM